MDVIPAQEGVAKATNSAVNDTLRFIAPIQSVRV
jgi:hypothetical protein